MSTEPTVLDDEGPDSALAVDPVKEEREHVKAKAKPLTPLEKIMTKIAPAHLTGRKLKVLIYGEPGVGKTTFIGTAPNMLIIDVENGTRTLSGKAVDVLPYENINQIEAAVKLLRTGEKSFDKYDTIAFDSLSEMQRRLLDQQLQLLGGGAPVYKADWGVYGENTTRLRMLLNAFKDIDKNLIVTCQAKQEKDDSTGITSWRPDLTPKLAASAAATFDIVGFLRINGKGERVLRVHPSKTVLAKTRVQLPQEIMNPTWDSINK